MRQILTLLAALTVCLYTTTTQAATPSAAFTVSATVLEVCNVAAVSATVNKSGVQSNCKYNTAYTVSREHTSLAAIAGSTNGSTLSYTHTAAQGANADVMITTVTY